MQSTTNRLLAAASICGSLVFTIPAFGQAVDVQGPNAGPTAKTLSGVTNNGDNPTAGMATPVGKPDQNGNNANSQTSSIIIPKDTGNGAGKMAPLNGDQSGVSQRADTKNAGPAARSAEATARKTVYDPNNQLGKSLEGNTKPDTAQQ